MKFSGLPKKTNVLLMMVSSSTRANDLKVLLVRVDRQLPYEFFLGGCIIEFVQQIITEQDIHHRQVEQTAIISRLTPLSHPCPGIYIITKTRYGSGN